jgi:hypothetical protein
METIQKGSCRSASQPASQPAPGHLTFKLCSPNVRKFNHCLVKLFGLTKDQTSNMVWGESSVRPKIHPRPSLIFDLRSDRRFFPGHVRSLIFGHPHPHPVTLVAAYRSHPGFKHQRYKTILSYCVRNILYCIFLAVRQGSLSQFFPRRFSLISPFPQLSHLPWIQAPQILNNPELFC